MKSYTVHYINNNNEAGSIDVDIGDTYLTLDQFIEELLNDHPGYKVTHGIRHFSPTHKATVFDHSREEEE